MHSILTAQEVGDTLNMIIFLSPKNTRRKNSFLAVCYSLNKEINLLFVNQFAEFVHSLALATATWVFFQVFESIPDSCKFS